MATQAELVETMRNGLRVSIPDLDTSIGTPVRKIIDVVAEIGAESFLDRAILDYQYDIDSMVANDLDGFVELFGMRRMEARRATGTVTFARNSAYTLPIPIPISSQVANDQNPPILFATTIYAELPPGDTTVEVPVQGVLGGSAGNIAPGSITRLVTPTAGITSLTNTIAFTGGTDEETDSALRDRFRKTALRHLAGTEAMYAGVALEDPDTLRVNIVGNSKRRYEQIQLTAGTGTSTVQDAAMIFANRETVGPNIYTGDILTPFTHYTFNAAVTPPTLTAVDTGVMPNGIYDLEYEYLPKASRNDPALAIMNRVDVFVDGVRAVAAAETFSFSLGTTFNNTVGNVMNRANFRRVTTEEQPVAGNIFSRLGFCPLLTIEDNLTVAGDDFVEGTDYWLVNETSPTGMGAKSRCGVEWKATANGGTPPSATEQVTINYTYNEVPRSLDAALRLWKLVTQDAICHQAKLRLLDMHLVIIITPGYGTTPARVEDEVYARIKRLVDSTGFASVLQPSDVLSEVHLVAGVDAVRFATEADDATDFAIQWVSRVGATLMTFEDGGSPGRVTDAYFADDELPYLNEVTFDIRAQNRFASGA